MKRQAAKIRRKGDTKRKKTIDECFDDVMAVDPQKQPGINKFPIYFTDRDSIRYCFKQTRVAWLQQFSENGKKNEIRRMLGKKPTQEIIDFLKRVRSRGIMLRNAYKFFDQSHRCPQELKDFVFNLGAYTDNAVPSRTQERLRIKRILRAGLKRPAFAAKKKLKIQFVTLSNFRRYARSIFEEINENLKKDVLDTERFHDTRKLLRQCSNLMQLPATDNIGRGQHWLCIKLHRLSAVLGNAHAELVARHLSPKGYCKYEFTIEKEWRLEFEKILPYLEKAVGI